MPCREEITPMPNLSCLEVLFWWWVIGFATHILDMWVRGILPDILEPEENLGAIIAGVFGPILTFFTVVEWWLDGFFSFKKKGD